MVRSGEDFTTREGESGKENWNQQREARKADTGPVLTVSFTTPYHAVQRWLRRENATLPINPCNENNDDHFNQGLVPLAHATTSDF